MVQNDCVILAWVLVLAELFLGKFQAEIQPEAGKWYEKLQRNEVWQGNGAEQPSLYTLTSASSEITLECISLL